MMQAQRSLMQLVRAGTLCTALLCAPTLSASADATAPLTLYSDQNTQDPADDEWGFFYTLDHRFLHGVGYRIAFEQPDPGGAFTVIEYLTNTGWEVDGVLAGDPGLGVPPLLELVATLNAPLPLVFGPIFLLEPSTPSYSVTHGYIEMDPNFVQIEDGIVTVPEPDSRLHGACILISLGVLVALRQGRRERRRRQIATGIALLFATIGATSLVAPTNAEAGVTIEDGPTYSETLGDLTIEFTSREWLRHGPTDFEFRFRVDVTNNGPALGPFGLFASKDASPSSVTSGELPVPDLPMGATKTLVDNLVMRQDRAFLYRPGSMHFCIFEAPAPNLPDGDPKISAIDAEIAGLAIDKMDPAWRLSVPNPLTDATPFSCGRRYFWNLTTTKGNLKILLFHNTAPVHVGNTIYLTRMGFYDSLSFHRIITGFVVQGGDPLGNGSGGPNGSYGSEFDATVLHDQRGILSMAHAGEGTDGSQFFVTFGAPSHLDGAHTVFGFVESGFPTLDAMEAVGTQTGVPTEAVFITNATISVE